MLELHVDPGVASELDLVILDPGWSGSGRTGAPGAPVLYLNRTVLYLNRTALYPNWKEVKGGRTKMY
jgi:hypothetical protein